MSGVGAALSSVGKLASRAQKLSVAPKKRRGEHDRQMTLDVDTDWKWDGYFVGEGGRTWAPGTALDRVRPVKPHQGVVSNQRLVLINGIMTDVSLQYRDMQELADRTGSEVIGIHNATRGMTRDLLQCVGDKLELEIANDRAVDTTEKVIRDALDMGKEVHFVAHSQGAIILSNALGRVESELRDEAPEKNPYEVAGQFRGIEATTLGGAAWTFPDGPEYRHYVNRLDVVPMLTGTGLDSLNPWGHIGAGAEVEHFTELKAPEDLPPLKNGSGNLVARFVDRTVHGLQDIYTEKL